MLSRGLFFCNYWLTYRCNSKCDFCNIWRNPSLKGHPDANLTNAKKNLEDLKKIGVRAVDFTGGEPLLNEDLPEILSYAKKLGFWVKLSTNGSLYPERAKELRGLPSRVYISFDTVSPEEYKSIRGVDGFDKIIESMEIAKKINQELCLFYTVTNENIHNIEDIVNFGNKNKVTVFIHPCFSYFDNPSLDRKNVKNIQRYFWHPFVRMSLPQLEFHYRGGNNINHPTCRSGISTVDIGPDNCITVPCSHRYFERVKIDGNLFSLYKSDKWKKLYKNIGRYDFCKNCTIDCYFGLSYWDRVGRYFLKQNLTILKDMLERKRIKNIHNN